MLAPRIVVTDHVLVRGEPGEEEILLIRHKKPELAGQIGVFGGKLEWDENILGCVCRETYEEVGVSPKNTAQLDPQLCRIASDPNRDRRFEIPTFCVVFTSRIGEDASLSFLPGEEIEDLFWCPYTELPELIFDHLDHVNAAIQYWRAPRDHRMVEIA